MARASYRISQSFEADVMRNSSVVWDALDKAGKEAQRIWKELADEHVGTRSHFVRTLRDVGWMDNPGDYRDSIVVRHLKNPTRQKVRVQAMDHKAHWLEYGTVKTPAFAMGAKTREAMRAEGYKVGAADRAMKAAGEWVDSE